MGTDTGNTGMILGCDIGNAFGYVSVLTDPGHDPLPLLPGKYHLDMGMPTDAYITPPEGKPIQVFRKTQFSTTAHRRKPEFYVRAIKTRLKEKNLTLPGIGETVDTDKVYAAITADLIALANEALPLQNAQPVYDIVFAFPASMADETELLDRMQKSIESVNLDGHQIHVAGRLPEPAAVAIDYLHYMQHIAPEEIRITEDQFTVLVYDLGHGTFDTAVVTAGSKEVPYILHTKAGLPEVGGKDFDKIIYNEFCRIHSERDGFVPKNTADRERIMEAAVNAKLELSSNENSVQEIQIRDDVLELEISRERFEQLSQDLLNQTIMLVQELLDFSSDEGININAVVLSGGSSKMPMVKEALEQLIEGMCPVVLYRPSEAVSFGAARYAYGIPQVSKDKKKEDENNDVLQQKTDCCYGLRLPAEGKLEGEILFVIPTGQKRPVESKPIVIYSSTSKLTVHIYRLREYNKNLDRADPRECESIRWFTFDVTPGENYTVVVTASEDYSILVTLTGDSGEVLKAGTNDPIR